MQEPNKNKLNIFVNLLENVKKVKFENLNIFLNMVTIILTGYITWQSYVIKREIDLVNNNIAKANLVKDLLGALSSSDDKKIQKDIALIILNRTINQDTIAIFTQVRYE